MTTPTRKYLKIANSLLEEIKRKGRLSETQMQIAERFGVTRQTVRHALDWLEREGKLTQVVPRAYRVAETKRADEVKVTVGAGGLKKKEGPLKIGFPLWADSLPSLDILRMVSRLTTMQDIHFSLGPCGGCLDVQFVGWEHDPDREKIARLCEEWDAFILEPRWGESSFPPDHPFFPWLHRAVMIGAIQSQHFNCVCPDFYSAGQLAVEECVRLGCSRILYTGRRDEPISHQFLRVASAEVAAGRHANVEILYAEGGTYTEDAFSAIKKFFMQGNSCDAVLAQTAPAAIGALRALDDLKIRVPEDVQLISIGSMAAVDFMVPQLTAITSSEHRLGQEVARMALTLAKGTASSCPNILVPMHLVQGQTTRLLENSPSSIILPRASALQPL